MANASVTINFEAADAEEAQEKISKWKLHEGCNVFWSVVTTGTAPMQSDAKGKLKAVPPPELPEVANGDT